MSRLSGRKAKAGRAFCCKRDDGPDADVQNPRCQMLNPDGTTKDGKPCRGRIVLHHKDHNPDNNPADWSNHDNRCMGHNGRSDPRGRQSQPKFNAHNRLKLSLERKRQQNQVGIRGMSAELAKSERITPIIEDWIREELRTEPRISMLEAMNACALEADCVQSTVKEKIYALGSKSKRAPFLIREEAGIEYIYLKSPEPGR